MVASLAPADFGDDGMIGVVFGPVAKPRQHQMTARPHMIDKQA
jgi:hypothetical protein